MTAMVDVALGLVFVYVILSLLSSALAEALEHYLRYRADYLRQGIEKLLMAGSTELQEELYKHPLIASLFTSSRLNVLGRSSGPAYIPSRQFVLALLDVVVEAGKPAGAGGPAGAVKPSPSTVADLLAGIDASAKANVIPEKLAGALRTLIADAGDDMEKVKANVQEWFDGSMDRVAGWYKRRAQFVLIIIGVCVAVGINADTLTVVQTLSNDAAVRSAVVAAAETYARENPRDVSGDARGGGANTGGAGSGSSSASGQGSEVTTKMRQEVKSTVEQLSVLGLPIGWRYFEPTEDRCGNIADPDDRRQCLIDQRVWPQWSARTGAQWFDDWWNQLASHLLGWLLTAFAISLGAPFWFDLLNKVMVIRSTVKPREKSQEEGSEDRQRATASQTVRVEIAQAKP